MDRKLTIKLKKMFYTGTQLDEFALQKDKKELYKILSTLFLAFFLKYYYL